MSQEEKLSTSKRYALPAFTILYGPTTLSIVPIRSKEITAVIKESEKILKRWQEHFTNLFDKPSSVDHDELDGVTQCLVNFKMDRLPNYNEVKMAINQLNTEALYPDDQNVVLDDECRNRMRASDSRNDLTRSGISVWKILHKNYQEHQIVRH
ncbi:Hypothetical predicted protein [Octopus vulgaris]|uniref:Uncharacterized protein n=1 Tax=Octopus vulgaris TaxID=6645 RepID=A0AA36B1H4_OCTVU|nr:Hypothetical predicted protein [Octopus vulgaris]